MFEVPKMLYGPRGWADLDDCRVVRNEAEEAAAERDGYFRAGEDAREDLVAAGTWPPGHTDLMVTPESIDAFIDANPPPRVSDVAQPTPVASSEPVEPGHNAPKRRGRPPKVK